MTAQFRRPPTVAAQRDLGIEQAIARGWPVLRVMTELGVTYEEYRSVRDRLGTLGLGAA